MASSIICSTITRVPFVSTPQSSSSSSRPRAQFLGLEKNLCSVRLTILGPTTVRSFKFCKNGVQAENAGISGSHGIDDFDPADVEQNAEEIDRMADFIAAGNTCLPEISTTEEVFNAYSNNEHEVQSRRHLVVCTGAWLLAILTLNCSITPLPVWADSSNEQKEENDGVVGVIKSLFDPDEKTKTGKVLPKAYLKSARELVKTLRESLEEDPKDNAKFRRTADAAKESIRDYLSNWRGQQKVVKDESYAVLEKAIRSLAGFYSKAGPSAQLSEEVKTEILNDLNEAEEYL